MNKQEKLLEMSKELVEIKKSQLNTMKKRLEFLKIANIHEFLDENGAQYTQTPAYVETIRQNVIDSVRISIIQLTGEYEGALEQVKELEENKENE